MPFVILALSLQLVPPSAPQLPQLVHSGWQMPGAPLIEDLSLSLRELGASYLINGGLLAVGLTGLLFRGTTGVGVAQLELGISAVVPFITSWAVWAIEDNWRGRTSYVPVIVTSVLVRVLVLCVAVLSYLRDPGPPLPLEPISPSVEGFLGSGYVAPALVGGALLGGLSEIVVARVASAGRVPPIIPLGRLAF